MNPCSSTFLMSNSKKDVKQKTQKNKIFLVFPDIDIKIIKPYYRSYLIIKKSIVLEDSVHSVSMVVLAVKSLVLHKNFFAPDSIKK